MDLSGISSYIVHLAIVALIFSVFAMSLNLTMGYTGMLVVCQGMFGGVAGYTMAILTTMHGFNFFLAWAFGILAAAIVALVVGVILLRLKGDYFVLGTVGFNIIFVSIVNNWQSLTRGPFGISGIPAPEIAGIRFSDSTMMLLLVILVFIFSYWACDYISKSNFGRALRGIREDETALSVFGYDVRKYKLVILIISAIIVSLETPLFASYVSYIDSVTYNLDVSIVGLSIVILGGLASNKGVVIGAVLIALLPEFLRFVGFPDSIAAQMRVFVYGSMLVILMIYRPQGIMGEFKL